MFYPKIINQGCGRQLIHTSLQKLYPEAKRVNKLKIKAISMDPYPPTPPKKASTLSANSKTSYSLPIAENGGIYL